MGGTTSALLQSRSTKVLPTIPAEHSYHVSSHRAGDLYCGECRIEGVRRRRAGPGELVAPRGGVHEGRGRMMFADSSVYAGEWCAGVKHGVGVETHHHTGDRYDGECYFLLFHQTFMTEYFTNLILLTHLLKATSARASEQVVARTRGAQRRSFTNGSRRSRRSTTASSSSAVVEYGPPRLLLPKWVHV